jgi:polar amino acid transport system permease protein
MRLQSEVPARRDPLVGPAFGFAIAGFCIPIALFAGIAIVLGRRAERRIVASRGAVAGLGRARRAQRLGAIGVAIGIVVLVVLFIATRWSSLETLQIVFFQWPDITGSFDTVFQGFLVDVRLFVYAEVVVLVWGLVLALFRIIPGTSSTPLRWFSAVYVDVFRGVPAIVTIALVGFGLPIAGVDLPTLPFESDSLFTYGVLALALVYGAYVAEVYRAGIESVHWSQAAASRSLGLSWGQTMGSVIVPQAVRRVIPPLLNDFIGLQKDAALITTIGILEGYGRARIYANANFSYAPFIVLAGLYLAITIPMTRLTEWLVRRDRERMQAGS